LSVTKTKNTLGDDPLSLAVHPERVAQAIEESEDEKILERLCGLFKVLGDVTRLKIVNALQGGEMCVSDLAAFLGMSKSAVSQHLRYLKYLAVVNFRRDARCIFYSLDNQHVQEFIKASLGHLKEKS
jgi:DNA-binding transcriptional ArsR family regulator